MNLRTAVSMNFMKVNMPLKRQMSWSNKFLAQMASIKLKVKDKALMQPSMSMEGELIGEKAHTK